MAINLAKLTIASVGNSKAATEAAELVAKARCELKPDPDADGDFLRVSEQVCVVAGLLSRLIPLNDPDAPINAALKVAHDLLRRIDINTKNLEANLDDTRIKLSAAQDRFATQRRPKFCLTPEPTRIPWGDCEPF